MLYRSTYRSMYGNFATSSISIDDANNKVLNMDSNDCINCINCIDCVECQDTVSCYKCRNCINCKYCTNCYNCNHLYYFHNREGERIIQLLNLTWPISFNTTHMAIGCEYHSINAWRNFTDSEIDAMADRAIQFWKKYKDSIFQTIEAFK